MLPHAPHANTSPTARPVPKPCPSAIFATSGVIAPKTIAGPKNTKPTWRKIRVGQAKPDNADRSPAKVLSGRTTNVAPALNKKIGPSARAGLNRSAIQPPT